MKLLKESRHTSLRYIAVGVGIVLTLSQCSVHFTAGDLLPKSNTPEIRSTAKHLEPGLLTAADLKGVPALPNLEKMTPEDVPIFEDPDPRGPCGTVTPGLDVAKSAAVVFANPSLTLLEVITEVNEGDARTFLDTNLADIRPGCAPYESTTHQGQTQRVSGEVVELEAVGDQRFGFLGDVRVEDQEAYVGRVVIRYGNRVVQGLVLSGVPVQEETVKSLAHQIDSAIHG